MREQSAGGRSPSWWKPACAACALCAATAIALPAQTFTTLFSFKESPGATPRAGLIQGTDGNLYGATEDGGPYGDGTLFEITLGGTLSTVYRFCKRNVCADGAHPYAALVQASDGNIYGTTFAGGANETCFAFELSGCGTVFKMTPNRSLKTIYSFCAQSDCTDGENPVGPLVQGSDGSFYGSTSFGGASGAGTAFKINSAGTLTTLHSFCSQTNCADGANPYAGLIQARDGNFYGTTYQGGSTNDGTVFKMTPDGALTTLHSFAGYPTEGANPYAGLVQAIDGNFYGTTLLGGRSGSGGTVFEITPGGALTTVYDFCSQGYSCPDGVYPEDALIQATDGNFYGTTMEGGANSGGTIFKVTSTGTLTTLYSFCSEGGCADGYYPFAGVVQATNGTLYGTTYYGGTSGNCLYGCGTVFSLAVGLGPFVETLPTADSVSAPGTIPGTGLTGATGATFSASRAMFKAVLPSEIATKVPSGVTTGTVEVTTPAGTLSSSVPFRAIP
jgi:uncharacterized repeat protein (TIGR03803 family)